MPADDATLKALQGDHQTDDKMSEEIKLFCDGISDTLKSQLAKYLTGTLSVTTPALMEATKNAPLHNMASERSLGMVDAQLRRAPNAHVDLISAKVKCTKNRTMQWLGNQSPEMQRKIVRSAVRQRRSVMLEQKERKKSVLRTLNQRLYEAVQKQEMKKTKAMEKVVAKLVDKGQELTTTDIDQEFPTTDPELVNLIVEICHEPNSVRGHDLSHLWFDRDNCTWDLYDGSICGFKKNKYIHSSNYTIEYWLPDCPEDSHKALLTVTQLVTDIILGDLVFT